MLSFFVLLLTTIAIMGVTSPQPIAMDVESSITEEAPIEPVELPELAPTYEPPKVTPQVKPEQPMPETGPSIPHIDNINDYEDLVQGLCPSERPVTDFEYSGVLPAIGLRNGGMSYGSVEGLKKSVEVFWSFWRVNPSIYPDETSIGSIQKFNLGYVALSFYIHYPTLSIIYHNTWDDEPGLVAQVKREEPELIATLDRLSAEMTEYLRYIDSAYTAKCPND